MAIKYNSFAFNELRKLKGDVNSSQSNKRRTSVLQKLGISTCDKLCFRNFSSVPESLQTETVFNFYTEYNVLTDKYVYHNIRNFISYSVLTGACSYEACD